MVSTGLKGILYCHFPHFAIVVAQFFSCCDQNYICALTNELLWIYGLFLSTLFSVFHNQYPGKGFHSKKEAIFIAGRNISYLLLASFSEIH